LPRPFLALLLALALPCPARAEPAPPALGLPLACVPGLSCWIPRYVDLDPGPGIRDYACGTLTGPAHSGTDFAIRDLALLRQGVPVLAAAAGVVTGRRDGMADMDVLTIDPATIDGRNCGNGVLLEHPGGWETQYCHLKQGSIAVAPGETVAKGRKLGEIGLSGETSFPHVHLSVRHLGVPVDPFRGIAGGPDCGLGDAPLWDRELLAALAYRPVMLTNIGFATGRIEAAEVRAGEHQERELPAAAPALVLWFEGYGFRAGDRARWRITGPDGAVVLAATTIEGEDRARLFRFRGERRPTRGWPPGTYTGEVLVERPGLGAGVRLRREVVLR
jgi:hypothetical protein